MSTGRGESPSPYAKAVSAEIRSQMGKGWWSGAKLAQATGLSQNYLAKRLRDELPFTLNDIDKIAKALEVDATVLVLAPFAQLPASQPQQQTNSITK